MTGIWIIHHYLHSAILPNVVWSSQKGYIIRQGKKSINQVTEMIL